MNRQTYLKDFHYDLVRPLNWILLYGCIANFLAAGMLYFFEKSNLLFTSIGFSVSILLGLLFLLRNRVPILGKLVIIMLIIFVHALLSLLQSGLIGTGIMALMMLQVIALVFLSLPNALIVGGISLLVVGVFTAVMHSGLLYFELSLLERMNSVGHWMVVLISLGLFFAIAAGTIAFLKTRLLENIEKLKRSNKVLAESNQKLRDNRKKLEHIAYYDTLTGLLLRSRFEELVDERLKSGSSSGFLILVNIKGFRLVNSIFGTETGDIVLRTIGDLFTTYQNDSNFIARMSGDEFAGWADGWDEETLKLNIAKFRKDIEHRLPLKLKDLRIDFFISAAAFPQDGNSFEECFRKAAAALTIAKETNSTHVHHFHHSMIQKAELELRMRGLLEQAIEKHGFEMYYQNKINIHTGEIVGVEALTRWNSAELGSVSPETFIPVIQKAQLMIPFSQTVFDIIFRELPALRNKLGEDIQISINTSPLFFIKPGFTEYVKAKVRQAGIDPTLVTLEITEDVFIEDIERIQTIIADLNGSGIKIALDDFGKGFSSIYYISHIQLDELKVDKSFIDDICCSEKSFGVFSSICDFAATLGYKTVAEGVETREQVDKIKQTRCQVVQGYYYSQPEPI
ncbi:MAG: EAL domain-containing protein [Spirochaetia bacterium]